MFSRAEAAVVDTVTMTVLVFAVPVAVMIAGANTQLASEGKPAQASLIVPLKPVEFATTTCNWPDPPGWEITTVLGCGVIAAKKPGVIVKLDGCVVELPTKLESPPYVADMLCVPVSKLKTPFGVAVFPWLFSAKLLFDPGTGPKESLNVTIPVAIPLVDCPATSARR